MDGDGLQQGGSNRLSVLECPSTSTTRSVGQSSHHKEPVDQYMGQDVETDSD